MTHRSNPRGDVGAPERGAAVFAEHAGARGVDVIAVRDEEREAADAAPYGRRVEHERQRCIETPAQIRV